MNNKSEKNWIIKNGTIYDGKGGAPFEADLKIADGKIVEIASDIPAGNESTFDAKGLIVTPGLIDFHVHVYDGMNLHSISPADAGLKTGVTTMLDFGSAGAMNYGTFHQYVIPAARETIFTLLNISYFGVQGHPEIPPYIGDLHDVQHFDVPSAVKCIESYREEIVGVKVRLTASLADNDVTKERAALKAALEIRDQTGLPLMVHHVMSAIPLDELLAQLKAGDVLTHIYHGNGDGGFTGENGAPGRTLLEARRRGVKMDMGHGSGAFAWRIAEAACRKHDFWPDSISSDIHIFNLKTPVIDLPTTMSKFLYLGMPLEKVIQCATSNPAAMMNQQDEFGVLAPGRAADISVLKLIKGEHSLIDSEGAERIAPSRLAPVCVFKNGERFECECDYDVD
jgi:dihydroorotase